jgi:hypothetical protein
MNKLIIGMVLVLGVSVAQANCGNDNGNGNGCSDIVGPQGPAGTNGTNGINGVDGVNGSNGTNGINGKDGTNGKDLRAPGAALVIDAAVRLYDGKRIQVQAFNTYQLDRRPQHDVLGGGTNMMFGARVVFKLGSSYEERVLAAQEKRIKQLEALLK